MPHLNDLELPANIHAFLEPLVGENLVSGRDEEMWIERGRIRMTLEDIGEGYNGDYDENDPGDRPLLRFYFFARNPGEEEMIELDSTSYCTSIDAEAPWEVRLAAACEIFNQVIGKLSLADDEEADSSMGYNARGACERMSNVSSGDYDTLWALAQAQAVAADLDQNSAPAQGSVRGPRI